MADCESEFEELVGDGEQGLAVDCLEVFLQGLHVPDGLRAQPTVDSFDVYLRQFLVIVQNVSETGRIVF